MTSTPTLLSDLLAECNREGIRLALADGGGLAVDAPQDVLTPAILGRLKVHKSDLLAMLSDGSVTPDERRRACTALVERLSAAYRGGPIDWPRLDGIEQRIEAATTNADLTVAIAEYEQAAQSMTLDEMDSAFYNDQYGKATIGEDDRPDQTGD